MFFLPDFDNLVRELSSELEIFQIKRIIPYLNLRGSRKFILGGLEFYNQNNLSDEYNNICLETHTRNVVLLPRPEKLPQAFFKISISSTHDIDVSLLMSWVWTSVRLPIISFVGFRRKSSIVSE